MSINLKLLSKLGCNHKTLKAAFTAKRIYTEAEKKHQHEWYLKNRERIKARVRERAQLEHVRLRNNELARVRSKQRRDTDPEYRKTMNLRTRAGYRKYRVERLEYAKSYRNARKHPPEFKAKEKAHHRRYGQVHKDRKDAANILWRKRNPDKVSAIAMRYNRKLLATPEGRVHARMHRAIRHSLNEIGIKKNRRSWQSFVGYSTSELKSHLETHFTKGMSWAALMRGDIHIDHVIPKVKFKFNSVDDIAFKRCWALENLKPMWASDNHKKKDRILQPSQIALGI